MYGWVNSTLKVPGLCHFHKGTFLLASILRAHWWGTWEFSAYLSPHLVPVPMSSTSPWTSTVLVTLTSGLYPKRKEGKVSEIFMIAIVIMCQSEGSMWESAPPFHCKGPEDGYNSGSWACLSLLSHLAGGSNISLVFLVVYWIWICLIT